MVATPTSRLEGLTTSVAEKAPVRVATTAAITLENEQTIDGVAVVEGDRVLVKDQADPVENGIYNCMANDSWERAKDFNGTLDCVGGTWVRVVFGTVNALTGWYVVGNRQLIPDTDDIEWAIWPNNIPNEDSGLTYLVHTQYLGTPETDKCVGGHVFDRAVEFEEDWTDSVYVRTSSLPDTALVLTVNYPSTDVASVGTLTLSTGGAVSVNVSAITSTANGLLKLTSPSTASTTIVDIFLTLRGVIA